MPIIKVDITKIQAELLLKVENQKKLAEQRLREIIQHHSDVVSLVLDAHKFDSNTSEFQIDIENRQMLVNVPDIPLEKITKPKKEEDVG